MNATDSTVGKLLDAGFSPGLLARVGGVNRSSASRWAQGARPRPKVLRRLESLLALNDLAPEIALADFVAWVTEPNSNLGDVSPAEWIARDWEPRPLMGAYRASFPVRREAINHEANDDAAVKKSLIQFSRAWQAIEKVNFEPLMRSLGTINGLGLARNIEAISQIAPPITEATSLATLMAGMAGRWNDIIKSSLQVYMGSFKQLPRVEANLAFAGVQGILQQAQSSIIQIQPRLIEGLLGRPPVGLGALSAAIDLQLNGALAVALRRYSSAVQAPFARETAAWRNWLPDFPDAFLRKSELSPGWFIAHAHVSGHASAASLAYDGNETQLEEVAAANHAVTLDYPSLLDMEVPQTGLTLRAMLERFFPDALEPMEGGLKRVRDGGADAARQGAASLRTALDKVAQAIAPGPKSARKDAYMSVLGIQEGDKTDRLIGLQVDLLYSVYQPLSDCVHTEGTLDGLRANSLGMASSLAAILSRWWGRQTASDNLEPRT